MKRVIVTTAVAALMASVLSVGIPAGAHRPDRFSLCAAKTRTGGTCGRDVLYVNETVWLRGLVNPPHANERALILRRELGVDTTFRRVGSAAINNRGRIWWKWEPSPEDVGEYVFRMRIRGHGYSNRVEVEYQFCPAC